MRQALTEALIDFEGRVGGGLARPSPAALHHRRSVPGARRPGRAFRGAISTTTSSGLSTCSARKASRTRRKKEAAATARRRARIKNAARRSSSTQTQPLRKQIAKLEQQMEKLGAELAAVEEQLADPALYDISRKAELTRLPAKAKPGQIRAGRDGDDLAGCAGTAGAVNAGVRSLALGLVKRPIPRMVARCMMRRCGQITALA